MSEAEINDWLGARNDAAVWQRMTVLALHSQHRISDHDCSFRCVYRQTAAHLLEIHKHINALCSSHSSGVSDATSNKLTWSGNDSSRMADTMSGAKVVRFTIRLT